MEDQFLTTVPEKLRETSNLNIALSPMEHGKAVGSGWSTSSDILYVCTSEFSSDLLATKHSLAIIAKKFDLMGWYICTSSALCEGDTSGMKRGWMSKFPLISHHPVSRHIKKSLGQVLHQSIHGFCDASSKAYAYTHFLKILLILSIDWTIFLNHVFERIIRTSMYPLPHSGAIGLSNYLLE